MSLTMEDESTLKKEWQTPEVVDLAGSATVGQ